MNTMRIEKICAQIAATIRDLSYTVLHVLCRAWYFLTQSRERQHDIDTSDPSLPASDVLQQREAENRRLKQLITDLDHDKERLQAALSKKR